MNMYYPIFIVVVLVLDLDVVAASWLGFCRFSSLKSLEVDQHVIKSQILPFLTSSSSLPRGIFLGSGQ